MALMPRGLRAWLLLGGFLLAAALQAQSVQLATQSIDPPREGDGATADNFGAAIATWEDTIAIGATGDVVVVPGIPLGVEQGSVYLFQRQGTSWELVRKLTAEPFGEDGDAYGRRLAMGAELLAVAAPNRRVGTQAAAGAVFVYQGQGAQTSLLQRLESPTAGFEERFGSALALDGSTLAVGVPGAARVEIYGRSGQGELMLQQVLRPPVSTPGGDFGRALALSGDALLIGAPAAPGGGLVFHARLGDSGWSDPVAVAVSPPGEGAELGASLAIHADLALVGLPGFGNGAVQMLARTGDGWQPFGAFTASEGQAGDRFGSALALDAERAVIAASAALNQEGAVYVFDRVDQQFIPTVRLDMVQEQTAARFGTAVASIAGGVLVGADREHVNSNLSQGAVRLYLAQASGYVLGQRLTSGDGAYFDRYGISVALATDLALVGAFLEDTAVGPDAGRVHWFRRVGADWEYAGAIEAPDGDIEDRFGIAVATDGERAIVGAYWDIIGDNVDQGSAYVYRREGDAWIFEAKLSAADGRPRDYFGFAVAIEGDLALIGARGASVPFLERGAAYVFERSSSGWAESARLLAPEIAARVYFGTSVAIDDRRLLIGAPGASGSGGEAGAGAAWSYHAVGGEWSLQHELRAPQPRANAAFGFSVAADRGRSLVGAFQDGLAATAHGSAYVFDRDGQLEARLDAAEPQQGEGLGIAVALNGDVAVLGSSGFDLVGRPNSGALRIFERAQGAWLEKELVLAFDAEGGDQFGRSVAVIPGLIAAGAPSKSRDNPLEGAAYLYPGDRLLGDGFE